MRQPLFHMRTAWRRNAEQKLKGAIVWITGEAGQSGAPVFFWAQIIGLSLKKP